MKWNVCSLQHKAPQTIMQAITLNIGTIARFVLIPVFLSNLAGYLYGVPMGVINPEIDILYVQLNCHVKFLMISQNLWQTSKCHVNEKSPSSHKWRCPTVSISSCSCYPFWLEEFNIISIFNSHKFVTSLYCWSIGGICQMSIPTVDLLIMWNVFIQWANL